MKGVLRYLFPNYHEFSLSYDRLVDVYWSGETESVLHFCKVINTLLCDAGSCEMVGGRIEFRKGQTRLVTGAYGIDVETDSLKDLLAVLHASHMGNMEYNGKLYSKLELYAEVALEIAHALR